MNTNNNLSQYLVSLDAYNHSIVSLKNMQKLRVYYDASEHEFKIWGGRYIKVLDQWFADSYFSEVSCFIQKVLEWFHGHQFLDSLNQVQTSIEKDLQQLTIVIADPRISLSERQQLDKRLIQLESNITWIIEKRLFQEASSDKMNVLINKLRGILHSSLEKLKQDLHRTSLPLTDFPKDILLHLFSFLKSNDMLNVSLVNSIFAKLIKEPAICCKILKEKGANLKSEKRLKLTLLCRSYLKELPFFLCKKWRKREFTLLAQHCPNLTKLHLINHSISNDEFIFIAQSFKHLNIVLLDSCKNITDTGIQAMAENSKQLTTLQITNCNRVTSKGIQEIAKELKHLTYLDLSDSSATDVDIQVIARHLTQLKILFLANCKQITSIRVIAENLQKLEMIHFIGCAIKDEKTGEIVKKLLQRGCKVGGY